MDIENLKAMRGEAIDVVFDGPVGAIQGPMHIILPEYGEANGAGAGAQGHDIFLHVQAEIAVVEETAAEHFVRDVGAVHEVMRAKRFGLRIECVNVVDHAFDVVSVGRAGKKIRVNTDLRAFVKRRGGMRGEDSRRDAVTFGKFQKLTDGKIRGPVDIAGKTK